MNQQFFLKLRSGKKLEMMGDGKGKRPTLLLVPGLHSDLHEYGFFDDVSQRLAQSFGVPTTIAALPLPVKTLIFISGAYYPEQSLAKLFKDLGVYNPKGDSYIKADYDSFKIGPQLWPDLRKYDLMKKMEDITQPLLIIHGKKDFIDWHWAKEAYDKAKSKKRLELHEEVEHDFDDKPEQFEWLMARLEPWLEKTLLE